MLLIIFCLAAFVLLCLFFFFFLKKRYKRLNFLHYSDTRAQISQTEGRGQTGASCSEWTQGGLQVTGLKAHRFDPHDKPGVVALGSESPKTHKMCLYLWVSKKFKV